MSKCKPTFRTTKSGSQRGSGSDGGWEIGLDSVNSVWLYQTLEHQIMFGIVTVHESMDALSSAAL